MEHEGVENLFFERFRGFDQRKASARKPANHTAKILSGCLVVIEMAFAAVYSVVHAVSR